MYELAQWLVKVIRIEAIWLATEPLDMRAGTDTALARVIKVFGAARPHHAFICPPVMICPVVDPASRALRSSIPG